MMTKGISGNELSVGGGANEALDVAYLGRRSPTLLDGSEPCSSCGRKTGIPTG